MLGSPGLPSGRRSGRDDFWGIARTRYIRRETKNHVPAILAATIMSKQPEKYGFDVEFERPIEYDSVTIDGAVDFHVLARCESHPTGIVCGWVVAGEWAIWHPGPREDT